ELTLQDYLEQVALVTDLDTYDTRADRVTLMTLHAAKGLEFPVVFMTAMEEGLFPHARVADDDIEEERRLCYLGMTRAMHNLYLPPSRRRRVFGDSQFNPRSRFIDEIPTHLLHEIASAPPAWDERRNGERAAWPPSERSRGRDTTADAGARVEYGGEGIRIVYDDEDGL